MLSKNLVKLIKSILKGNKPYDQYVFIRNGNMVVTDNKRLLVMNADYLELKDGSYKLLVDSNGLGKLEYDSERTGPDYSRVIPKELRPSVKLPAGNNTVSVLNMLISKAHSSDTVLYGIDTSFAKDFADFAKSLKSDILVELPIEATYPCILSCNENDYRYICMPIEYKL